MDYSTAIRGLEPLGLVENMSGYVCPSCGHHDDIFSRGGGKHLAARKRSGKRTLIR